MHDTSYPVSPIALPRSATLLSSPQTLLGHVPSSSLLSPPLHLVFRTSAAATTSSTTLQTTPSLSLSPLAPPPTTSLPQRISSVGSQHRSSASVPPFARNSVSICKVRLFLLLTSSRPHSSHHKALEGHKSQDLLVTPDDDVRLSLPT